LLESLSKHIVSLAESTMLSFLKVKALKKEVKILNVNTFIRFQLTGIKEGSTILNLEAPKLSDTIDGVPQLLFENIQPEDLIIIQL
jgi:hypothetical protein